ncbi:MAG: putative secreted protein, partial [Verrucomicrobiales bacterium]|nr:putative secreted protein [Verrucomicrobiales bacterium]
YSTPTPGAANGNSTIVGALDPVHFSADHGFLTQAFNLSLSAAAGATIRYTLEGSEPTLSNGQNYSAPIPVNQTTVVRAAAFQTGMLPALTETRSYLFIESVLGQPVTPAGYPSVWNGQGGVSATADYAMDPRIVTNPLYSNLIRTGLYSLPALSISLLKDDLFGTNGIYSNATMRDDASDLWDRASSVELIFPDGSPGFNVKSGLQILGGASREEAKTPKHSFRIGFKDKFGAGKLAYPFYQDSPLQEYNTLVLDATYNYGWTHSDATQRQKTQYVRDQWTADMQNAMGGIAAHGKYVHLFLNGLYWGIYDVHERPDDDFSANYGGGDKSEYDVLKVTSSTLQVVAGNATAFNAMMALANSGLSNDAQYQQIKQYLDLENFIDYMIINIYGGNTDWPSHNWYAFRRRVAGSKFKWPVWDAEYVLKGNEDISNNLSGGNPATLYNNLRLNAEFRLLFADRLQKHFFNGGVFYVDAVNKNWDATHPERNMPAAIYMRRANEVDSAVVAESARWGDYRNPSTPYTRNTHWLAELNALLYITNGPSGNTLSYFPNRSATVLNQFKAINLYPAVVAPNFSQFGGRVPFGFNLSLTAPAGTIFFTTNGNDPRVPVTGAADATATAYSSAVTLNSTKTIRSRVLSNGTWSALTEATFNVSTLGIPIRFTELNYNPVGGDTYEFFEIQNMGTVPVDLSNCSFSGVTYSFPLGTSLAGGARMTLASDTSPSGFASRYPAVAVSGYYGGKLSNTGERLALLDRFGNTITSVTFNNAGGWPTQADGKGYTLEVINALGNPNDPANWKASAALNGTPGAANSVPGVAAVVINEVMADNVDAVSNDGTFPDWVELRNTSGSPVNLTDWSLSNNGTARRYVLPSTTLSAGGYLVIWCDSATNSPGLHTGFNLSRLGENLFLYDSQTNRVDGISFGPQVSNLSIGRVGGSWVLTQPTPGANNVSSPIGSASNLVINEWMANPLTAQSDWLELYNKDTLPVPLQGIYLGTSNVTQQFEALSFIPPSGYVQLFADEGAGYDHLDFKLSSSGETIILSDSTGAEINRVSFGAQAENISQGKFPNGSASVTTFANGGSPGTANAVVNYTGPLINELFAKNNSYYDANGDTPNWIELFNSFGADFNLAGMSLTDDPASPGQFIFPAGSTVPANGYLVINYNSS